MVQMNVFQDRTNEKYLEWLHSEDKLKVYVSIAYSTYPGSQ